MTPKLSILSLLAILCCNSVLMAEDAASHAAPLFWHSDYGKAYDAAKQQQRMLLLYFQSSAEDTYDKQFQTALEDTQVQTLAGQFVLLRVPVDYQVTIDGEASRLLSHSSFSAMHGKAGFAIVDLTDADSKHYGSTVSAIPFQHIGYYAPSPGSVAAVRTMLALPPGSITQRSMIYAVRLHPEKPASTNGRAEPYLFTESAGHSAYMARIHVQGHQGFDSRFQRILANLGTSGAKEVVAESWRGEQMLPACFSCVHSWRQSPGHWEGVSGTHSAYGYDIRRGSNGIWYATGLFAG